MKKIIKSFLRFFGLYRPIYTYYIERSREKFSDFKICSMNFMGVKLRFNTKDDYSKSWFFPRFGNGHVHEPGTTKIFIDHVNENSNVFDIGGHLGYFSCVAGNLSKHGVVCVFEVDSNCIELITENLELNALNNVRVYNMAVSDTSGHVSIPNLKVPNPGLRINSKNKTDQLLVPSISIDEFVEKEGIIPDFIKIDIEGAEYKVLKGMTNTLKIPSLTVLIEIHVSQLEKYYNTNYKEVLTFLIGYGFKLEKVEAHRTKKMVLREIKPDDELKGNVMIVCKKF